MSDSGGCLTPLAPRGARGLPAAPAISGSPHIAGHRRRLLAPRARPVRGGGDPNYAVSSPPVAHEPRHADHHRQEQPRARPRVPGTRREARASRAKAVAGARAAGDVRAEGILARVPGAHPLAMGGDPDGPPRERRAPRPSCSWPCPPCAPTRSRCWPRPSPGRSSASRVPRRRRARPWSSSRRWAASWRRRGPGAPRLRRGAVDRRLRGRRPRRDHEGPRSPAGARRRRPWTPPSGRASWRTSPSTPGRAGVVGRGSAIGVVLRVHVGAAAEAEVVVLVALLGHDLGGVPVLGAPAAVVLVGLLARR